MSHLLKQRNRLVSFRLSDEEYDRLKEATKRADSRSVSDFAREGVLAYVAKFRSSDDPQVIDLEERVENLTRRIAVLENHELAVIAEAISSPEGRRAATEVLGAIEKLRGAMAVFGNHHNGKSFAAAGGK